MTSREGAAGDEGRSVDRRRPDPAVVALAGVAGLLAAFADAHPTVHPAADACYRIAFAVLLTLATSRARRWTWVVLAAAVLIGARTPVALLCGGAAGVIAVGCLALDHRRRWLGALVGALGSVGLLHLGPWGPFGLTALVGIVGVTPLAISALRNLRPPVRRRVMRTTFVVAGLVVIAGFGFGVAALLGGGAARHGLDEARAGVAAAKTGDDQGASDHLSGAASSFTDADEVFGAWYTKPSELVPVLSYQAGALADMSALGHDLSVAADDTATRANYRGVGLGDGRVDLDRVRSLEAPLREIGDSLRAARSRTSTISTEWMAPPIRTRYDELIGEIDDAQDETDIARQTVQVAPALLGGDGVRTYFVMFTTPAESRATGGFMGSWAELTIDAGKPSLTRVGRNQDIAVPVGTPPLTIDAPEEYVARYGPVRPDIVPGDVTSSPDFPSVARAIASLYEQSKGGKKVDGVLSMDPYALAAMLSITGPIRVDGLDGELNTANAADILLKRQYVEFGVNDQRIDFLHDAAHKTFDAFLHQKSLKPQQLSSALGPMVAERRLTAFSFKPDEQELIEQLGMSGAFPRDVAHDFFSFITQNSGNNKIDVFLHRTIAYHADFDPDTGDVAAQVTIDLHNDSPSDGLPPYVIHNRGDSEQPDGTNWVWFNFYSPLELDDITAGDQEVDVQFQHEFGINVYSGHVAVPAGGDARLQLKLTGSVQPGSAYEASWFQQPTVNPDTVTVTVRPLAGWRPDGGAGLHPEGDEVTQTASQRTDGDLRVTLTK